MKRNVGSAKALAVILSATLALSPSITVAATAGENAANLSATVEEAEEKATAESTEETSEEKVSEKADESVKDTDDKSGEAEEVSEKAEEENGADKEAQVESQEEVQSEEEKTASDEESSEEEELPLFEEVDPEEEGLEAPVTAVDALETEVPVEEKDPDEQTRVIIVMEGDSVLDKGYDTENLADNSAAMNLSENIIAEQEETVEKISAEALDGQQLDVNYNLSIITNAVSADVAYKDIDNIVKVDGVAAVYVAQKYVPQETSEHSS